jgi:hypothetical protein
MPRLPGAAVALLLAAAVDAAEIYRCLGDAGEVLFQATACAGGHALNPAPLNSLGGELRPGERALLERAAQAAPARAKARRNGPTGAERRSVAWQSASSAIGSRPDCAAATSRPRANACAVAATTTRSTCVPSATEAARDRC